MNIIGQISLILAGFMLLIFGGILACLSNEVSFLFLIGGAIALYLGAIEGK